MLNDNPRLKKNKKLKNCYLLAATLKFEQQIPEGNRTCLMWPKISLKLKDFPPKKKKEKRVKEFTSNLSVVVVVCSEIWSEEVGEKSLRELENWKRSNLSLKTNVSVLEV